MEDIKLVKIDLSWRIERVEGGWWYKFYTCPNCKSTMSICNHFPEVHKKCDLYKLGYRTKIRCRCDAKENTKESNLYVSKLEPRYFEFDPKVKEENWDTDTIEFEKVIETEFDLPWYYEKDEYGNDVVYNCVGDKVLSNEEYYPTCAMDKSMMKKLIDKINENTD